MVSCIAGGKHILFNIICNQYLLWLFVVNWYRGVWLIAKLCFVDACEINKCLSDEHCSMMQIAYNVV